MMIPTIHAAAESIRAGWPTPVELLDECLANIDRYEDRVHAWVFVDRDGARAEAQRLTDEVKRAQVRGPLHGIPIAIKDIFDVSGWPTAAGGILWCGGLQADVWPRQLRRRRAAGLFDGPSGADGAVRARPGHLASRDRGTGRQRSHLLAAPGARLCRLREGRLAAAAPGH